MPSPPYRPQPPRCATFPSTASRNKDLPLVSSLIAYWDTLGWVHFGEGDLNKAEKYVAAAWELGHHGEVGDHLGQIYQKRGEKDRALRTYALSMNGLRPAPETRGRLASWPEATPKPTPPSPTTKRNSSTSAPSTSARPRKPATPISSSLSAAGEAQPQKSTP